MGLIDQAIIGREAGAFVDPPRLDVRGQHIEPHPRSAAVGEGKGERLIESRAADSHATPRDGDPPQLDQALGAGYSGQDDEAGGTSGVKDDQMGLILAGDRFEVALGGPSLDPGRDVRFGLNRQDRRDVRWCRWAQRDAHSPERVAGLGSIGAWITSIISRSELVGGVVLPFAAVVMFASRLQVAALGQGACSPGFVCSIMHVLRRRTVGVGS